MGGSFCLSSLKGGQHHSMVCLPPFRTFLALLPSWVEVTLFSSFKFLPGLTGSYTGLPSPFWSFLRISLEILQTPLASALSQ